MMKREGTINTMLSIVAALLFVVLSVGFGYFQEKGRQFAARGPKAVEIVVECVSGESTPSFQTLEIPLRGGGER